MTASGASAFFVREREWTVLCFSVTTDDFHVSARCVVYSLLTCNRRV